MKLTIFITTKMVQKLKGYPFTILIYYFAYFKKNDEIPSMRKIQKALKISYPKVRESVVAIYSFFKSDNHADSHTLLENNYYSPILTKIRDIYTKYTNSSLSKKVVSVEEITWNRIVDEAGKYYTNIGRFYWRTKSWVHYLIKEVKQEGIDEYIKWFFEKKAGTIEDFNAGIFCCSGMIQEYKNSKKIKYKLKTSSVEKKETFREQAEEEQKKIFKNLMKRKEKNQLDEYDEELLKYFRSIGWIKN